VVAVCLANLLRARTGALRSAIRSAPSDRRERAWKALWPRCGPTPPHRQRQRHIAGIAEKWDLSTVPCDKFLSFDKNTVNILLAWVDGYYREEDDPPIIDSDKYLTNAKRLGDYCRAHPEIGLITATDKLFEKK
jgi:acid stress chaperone HdeB